MVRRFARMWAAPWGPLVLQEEVQPCRRYLRAHEVRRWIPGTAIRYDDAQYACGWTAARHGDCELQGHGPGAIDGRERATDVIVENTNVMAGNAALRPASSEKRGVFSKKGAQVFAR